MAATQIAINRAATAIRRNGTSRPLALLLANELVHDADTVLDYGCGHGEDVAHLTALGYDARGWDPHHRPDGDRSSADVVLCSYVLNVIEDPTERLEVLTEVHRLARQVAVVAVRTTAERALMEGATRHGDGWITTKNTFQTLVVDEAHNFIPETFVINDWEHKAKAQDTSMVLMESRKFGLGFSLISQRTAMVTKSALSQCNTVFAFQAVDQTGLDYLEGLCGRTLSRSLPTLPHRTTIAMGQALTSNAPVVALVDEADVVVH
jgi:hypothetical protein